MASAMLRSSAPMPGNAPGVSMRVMTGRPNFSASLHQAHRLAISFGVGAAEVAFEVFLGIAALLVADDHHPLAADAGESAGHGSIIADVAVAMELAEIGESERDVIEHERAVRVTGDLHALPWGEVFVNPGTCFRELGLHHGDLGRHVDVLGSRFGPEFFEFAFEFDRGFFEFEELHARSFRIPGADARREMEREAGKFSCVGALPVR
jgi:hypothetical protein